MKKPAQKKVLDRAEWDFSAVAEIELEACLRYELAREVIDLERDLFGNPSDRDFDLPDNTPDEANALPESGIVPTVVNPYYGYFPLTPWLQIPLNDRLESVDEFELARTAIFPVHTENCDPTRFYKVNRDGDEVVPFAIRWTQSDASIVDDFRRWVSENRPKQVRAVVERGRHSLWDDLRCLSALRLRHSYSVEDAVRVTSRALGNPLYTHRPAWEKACKRAIGVFHAVFPGAGDPRSAEKKSNRKPRFPKRNKTKAVK